MKTYSFSISTAILGAFAYDFHAASLLVEHLAAIRGAT